VAAPFQTCEFDIMYNEGISVSGDLLDVGVEKGVIKKSGNSYMFGEEKLGVGRETAKSYLRANPKLMNAIRKDIWQQVRAGKEDEKQAEAAINVSEE